MENYRIENNTLFVDFEPFNEIEEFGAYCFRLLDVDCEDIFIHFSDKVFFLSSQYIGVLLMTVAGAKMKNKSLTIACSKRLGRVLCIIGGETLSFDLRDGFLDNIEKELLEN